MFKLIRQDKFKTSFFNIHIKALIKIIQGIQRDINCLSEDNKATRKRAIEKIGKELTKKKPPLNADVMQGCLDTIIKPVLKTFSDPSEKYRELSIQLVLE